MQSNNKSIKAENKDRGNDAKSWKPFVSHVSFKGKMSFILLLLIKLSVECLVSIWYLTLEAGSHWWYFFILFKSCRKSTEELPQTNAKC